MNIFYGKLALVFCMTQFVPPPPGEGKRRLTDSSQFGTNHLPIDSRPTTRRGDSRGAPPICHPRARRHLGGKRITRFLIADLPIRNSAKPCALNKISVSNRQKTGIFLRPATYNPKPATRLSNPCPPHFGGATTQSETDKV